MSQTRPERARRRTNRFRISFPGCAFPGVSNHCPGWAGNCSSHDPRSHQTDGPHVCCSVSHPASTTQASPSCHRCDESVFPVFLLSPVFASSAFFFFFLETTVTSNLGGSSTAAHGASSVLKTRLPLLKQRSIAARPETCPFLGKAEVPAPGSRVGAAPPSVSAPHAHAGPWAGLPLPTCTPPAPSCPPCPPRVVTGRPTETAIRTQHRPPSAL